MKPVYDYGIGFARQFCPAPAHVPVTVALSGGRSSATMLKLLLELFGGVLPANYTVVFNNTGKEHEKTYVFLEEIEQRWQVPIIKIEFVGFENSTKEQNHVLYKEVTFQTLARNGEPFTALNKSLGILPGRIRRLCTLYMKVAITRRYMLDRGIVGGYSYLGYRADEHSRLVNALLRCGREKHTWTPDAPLLRAGLDKKSVLSYWKDQKFDLEAPEGLGNCDLCMMKPVSTIIGNIRKNPLYADWWIAEEAAVPVPATFINKLPMTLLRDVALGKIPMPSLDPMDEMISSLECHCTD